MDKVKKFLKQEGVYYGILAVMLIAFFIPYASEYLPKASENGFHYARIYSLAETLKIGIFPAKIRPMLMKGFGYGVGFFYPDFFSYPSAILVIMGMDVIKAIIVQIVVAGIIGAISVFHSIDKLVDDKRIALVIDILYFGTLCMWNNLFDGFGIGAFIAQLFLPLAFSGLIRAFRDDKGGYIDYAIAIVVVVLNHHLTFISMMVAMVMLVVINIKKIIDNPKVIGKLFGVSVVGLLFTAQYWMPAIELAVHTKYKVIYDNFIDINDHILNFSEVMENITWPYFVVFVIAIGVFAFTWVKTKKAHFEGLAVLIATVIHIILMQSQLFWRGPIGQFFAFFQSTERLIYVLMALMLIFIAIAAAYFKKELENAKVLTKKKYDHVFYISCIILVIATRMLIKADFYNPGAYTRDNTLTPEMIVEENGISCGEWLPIENEPSECHGVENALADDGSSADGFKHDNYKYFEAWVLLDKKYYDAPYIYYYGYKAYLIDENGNPVQELKVGEALDHNGYVRVYMPENGEGAGHMMVIYQKTTVQKIAYLITIATVLAIIALSIYSKKSGKEFL